VCGRRYFLYSKMHQIWVISPLAVIGPQRGQRLSLSCIERWSVVMPLPPPLISSARWGWSSQLTLGRSMSVSLMSSSSFLANEPEKGRAGLCPPFTAPQK
jgi:hypothetical protein